MTFAIYKQVLYQNRIYDIESVSIVNGQAYCDATYRVYGIPRQLEDDDVRLELGKRVKH